jgi:cell division protein FtsQ
MARTATPVNPRIEKRRAQLRVVRRRRQLRAFVALICAGAVAGGVAVLERSDLVALSSVEVVGLGRVSDADARQLLGFDVGESLLRTSLRAAQRRLLADPRIADAAVVRDGAVGVRVTVVETVPAMVVTSGQASALVGADGTVLQAGDTIGVPRVALDVPIPPVGQGSTDVSVSLARDALLTLPGPLAALVTGARVIDGSLELDLLDGTLVRWGDAGRADEKQRALGAVFADLNGLAVTFIDVRAPSAPTVLP